MSWFTDLFKKKQPVVKKPVVKEPVVQKPTAPDIGENKYALPTRQEMLAVINGMITGSIQVRNGAYNTIRETHGKNRSPRIDSIIKRQGGSLGQPYCAYGAQEVLDEVCEYYKVPRSFVKLPEGGGTQSLWGKLKNTVYKVLKPVVCGWVIWYYNDSAGHIGWTLSEEKNMMMDTFEFNTNASDSTRVVRDGQGAGYCKRSTKPTGRMKIRGYVDCYTAICDGIIAYRRTLGL